MLSLSTPLPLATAGIMASPRRVRDREMGASRTAFWFLLTWLYLLGPGCFAATGQTSKESAQSLPAKVDENWDEVFTTRLGWTGGDGGGTVDLGDGRVLWMFADSFIGGIADGKHAPGSHMVNNVFAVQKLANRSSPKLTEFDFKWGPDGSDGKPTAWIAPDPAIMNRARPLDDNAKPHGWFWPAGGGCVVKSQKKTRLYAFLFHMGSNGKKGVWGFENIGGAMIVVDNPEQPIKQWNVRQIDLPFTKDALKGIGKAKADGFIETNWGLACVTPRTKSTATISPQDFKNEEIDASGNEYVYIYGDQHRQYKNRQLLVARVRPGSVEQFNQWEFYTGDGGWQTDCDQAHPIADEIGAEFSVEKISFEGKTKYVMVHSHSKLGTTIYIRTAEAPQGPWSNPVPVYEVTDVKKSKNYFTYAARGHSMVSPARKLLITYIVNSNDFWEMASDASIYRPRCITIPLSMVFEQRQSK